jgi:hypothetical protein
MFPCFKKYWYQCLLYCLKVDAGAFNKYVEYRTGFRVRREYSVRSELKRIFKLFRPSDLKIWASKTYSLEANIQTLNGSNFFILKIIDVI